MKYVNLFLIIAFAFISSGCDRRKVTRMDTLTTGKAVIASDDCFSPIINEEIAVFEGVNAEASITPIYTNEVNAINLLLQDSVRLIISARELSTDEANSIRNKNLIPRATKIALDGVALIINKSNRDSLISVASLKKILTGEIRDWNGLYPASKLGAIRVVFDNPNSSTVHYIKDSVMQGMIFGDNVKSLESNSEVLDFVSRTPNAMGFIGVSWICNPKDTTNLTFDGKIRVMSVSAYDEAREDNSYQPFAAWVAMNKYPFVRDVYIITSDLHGTLPSGFMQFVSGQSGQRLIMKSGMVPANTPMRLVSVRTE